jgi:hypothetical protein
VITANNPGPSYSVNWGNNFGGGTVVITAEVNVNGAILTDTYIGKIEGQTFADDANFKTNLLDYLDDPDSDQTTPTVRDDVGYDKFFRMIAYKETNASRRYEHFYPSIYGVPKSAIYPVENGGGDGGFGLMQLTIPSANYLQIWNYITNIDAAVSLIKEKLATAKTYPNIVRTRGCTKEPYINSKGNWVYPCRPMPTTAKYPRANDFSADELRVDVYSLYNSNWHYWFWNDKKKKWEPYESDIESQQRGAAYADSAEDIKDNPPSDFE